MGDFSLAEIVRFPGIDVLQLILPCSIGTHSIERNVHFWEEGRFFEDQIAHPHFRHLSCFILIYCYYYFYGVSCRLLFLL